MGGGADLAMGAEWGGPDLVPYFSKSLFWAKVFLNVAEVATNFGILFWPKIGPQGVFWDEKERNRRRKRQRV